MGREATYSAAARRFHWWTVLLFVIQVPLGVYMMARAGATNFDALTGTLYDTHKTLGLVILVLVLARLAYRLLHGTPADEPTITWWQRAASHVTHWSLYGLLILVPLLGWAGVSLYGARELFGTVTIPPLAPEDKPASDAVFLVHRLLALLTVVLAAMHVGAAVVLHWLIRGDGVLARMLPWAERRGRSG
jgi:cytochrome b561